MVLSSKVHLNWEKRTGLRNIILILESKLYAHSRYFGPKLVTILIHCFCFWNKRPVPKINGITLFLDHKQIHLVQTLIFKMINYMSGLWPYLMSHHILEIFLCLCMLIFCLFLFLKCSKNPTFFIMENKTVFFFHSIVRYQNKMFLLETKKTSNSNDYSTWALETTVKMIVFDCILDVCIQLKHNQKVIM